MDGPIQSESCMAQAERVSREQTVSLDDVTETARAVDPNTHLAGVRFVA
jgi:hypothetical protein